MRTLFTLIVGVGLVLLAGCTAIQRKFVFFPSHRAINTGLTPWVLEGRTIGYSRQVTSPETVWLMLHGNAGQAADRSYAIPSFSKKDSVFILEYPGYGAREGKPSKASIDAAASEAYRLLRRGFPNTPVCVMGESIGTGPACALATQSPPPDKIVLVVPFDKLTRVAADHVPYLPVGLIWGASWDNVRVLSTYKGRVDIFGALGDEVIPIAHARTLAQGLSSAKLTEFQGGHNDWACGGRVAIRNP